MSVVVRTCHPLRLVIGTHLGTQLSMFSRGSLGLEDVGTDVLGESDDAIVITLSDDAKLPAVVAPVDLGTGDRASAEVACTAAWLLDGRAGRVRRRRPASSEHRFS